MRRTYKEHKNIDALLSSEKGRISKPFGAYNSVAVVFPNSYFLGMSNLGFQFIYHRINNHPDWLCHRGFLNPLPGYTIEEKRQLREYNVVAFSISYELDFCSLLSILEQGGIELYSHRRRDKGPLIMAGGAAVTMNPLAILDFVDVCVLGDGEGMLEPVLDLYQECHGNKEELLGSLARYRGFLCSNETQPGIEIKHPNTIANLDSQPIASEVVTSETEFADTCLVEISRGCPHHCAFCWIGHRPTPFRVVSWNRLIELIPQKALLTARFGFVSSAVGDYPYIKDLCQFCDEEQLGISFSSLRPEAISPEILNSLARSGQQTLTLAPETGNDSLRKKIGKDFSNQYLMEKIALAIEAGIRNIKLYFLVGLPGETMEDINSISALVGDIQSILAKQASRKGTMGTVTANIGIFTPRPDTPFARYQMPEVNEIKTRLGKLRRNLPALPNVECSFASSYEAKVQWLLASHPQKAPELIMLAHKQKGNWKQALRRLEAGQ